MVICARYKAKWSKNGVVSRRGSVGDVTAVRQNKPVEACQGKTLLFNADRFV